MQPACRPVARNLRRWRLTRELTLSGLATRAGVAKSTVSLIERGEGNPSIETVSALAMALGIPFASLFQEESPRGQALVVRASEGQLLVSGESGLAGEGMLARRILTRSGAASTEIYTLALEQGALRHAAAQAGAPYEHLLVAAGVVEVGGERFREVLHEGDLISFRTDGAHTYRALEGPARAVAIREYPADHAANPIAAARTPRRTGEHELRARFGDARRTELGRSAASRS